MSDGQIRSEEGKYKDGEDIDGNPVKILVVQGAYSHVGPGKRLSKNLLYNLIINNFQKKNHLQMVRHTGSTTKVTRMVTSQKQERV